MHVKFVAVNNSPKPEEMPLLHAMEIVRERVLELGCTVSNVEISDKTPAQTVGINLKNLRDEPFEGTLLIEQPQGFGVNQSRIPITLGAGKSLEHEVTLSVPKGVPAKTYTMRVKLVDKEETPVLERTASVEHLGRLTRLAFTPVADAHVVKRYLTRNQGAVGTMLIDGGDRKMNDDSHAQAFLRYKWEPLKGKIVRVSLRVPNGDNPTGDAGKLRLVKEPWSEKEITYEKRPAMGATLLRLGSFGRNEAKTFPLDVELEGKTTLDLAIDPTSCDGYHLSSRERGNAPTLVIEYIQE